MTWPKKPPYLSIRAVLGVRIGSKQPLMTRNGINKQLELQSVCGGYPPPPLSSYERDYVTLVSMCVKGMRPLSLRLTA